MCRQRIRHKYVWRFSGSTISSRYWQHALDPTGKSWAEIADSLSKLVRSYLKVKEFTKIIDPFVHQIPLKALQAKISITKYFDKKLHQFDDLKMWNLYYCISNEWSSPPSSHLLQLSAVAASYLTSRLVHPYYWRREGRQNTVLLPNEHSSATLCLTNRLSTSSASGFIWS